MNQAHDSYHHNISIWTPDDVWNWLSKQEFANELQVAHFRLINGELLQRLKSIAQLECQAPKSCQSAAGPVSQEQGDDLP